MVICKMRGAAHMVNKTMTIAGGLCHAACNNGLEQKLVNLHNIVIVLPSSRIWRVRQFECL